MSINPSQSWITPNTSLFGSGGSGGGSNFPQGIDISNNFIQLDPYVRWASPCLAVENTPLTGPAIPVPFSANPFFAFNWDGSNATTSKSGSYSASNIFYQGSNGSGNGSIFVNTIDGNLGTSNAFDVQNVNTISGTKYTTGANPTWNPLNFTLRPDNASDKGTNYIQVTWDAVDTGANTALVAGADASGAFIYSFWPGYITMPLTIGGQDVTISSDNETFLYGQGNAGGLGTLSTGTPFLSGSNFFSSITTPVGVAGQYKANMYALFSTLQTSYPACFN